ncbi:MAG: hypothetical protein ACKOCZ_08840 [Betaproteobacteria bacterium]
MTDPVTTIGLGAVAAYLGKDGLEKLLGPTADYLGEGLRDFTKRRAEAVGRIFGSAQDKLGAKAEAPGQVPPKVLKTIVNEASYANSTLEVEYFGGILASSRTEAGRDDRGARLARIVEGLSSYQLRTHYLVYSTIRTLFSSRNLPFNMEGRPKMRIVIPFEDYFSAMAFDQAEMAQVGQLLNHVFFGLHTEGLIEDDFQYGPRDALSKRHPNVLTGGISCQPSALGAELFRSAFGRGTEALESIFSPDLAVAIDGVPNGIPSATATEA